MLPTTAPIVELTLGGKARKLYFGFRAWHALNINPLRPAEVTKFLEELDPQKAASWILAGLQAYQALAKRLAEQDSEPPPADCAEAWDLDRVLDLLDSSIFMELMETMNRAAGASNGSDPEGNPARPMDQTGENSTPSGATTSALATESSGTAIL